MGPRGQPSAVLHTRPVGGLQVSVLIDVEVLKDTDELCILLGLDRENNQPTSYRLL